LMALSALSMAFDASHPRSSAFDYIATAETHYCKSLQHLRASMSKLELVSPDALLACSILLIPCGLALARATSGLLRLWVCHLRGFRALGDTISGTHSTLRSPLDLIPFPQLGTPEPQTIDTVTAGCATEASGDRLSRFCSSIRSSKDEAVNKLRAAIAEAQPRLSSLDAEAYTAAIDEVQFVMDYTLNYGPENKFRPIFSWATEIPPRFVELLGGKDELAMAITAHWLVCTLLLDEVWFMTGFGAFRIEAVTEMLEQGMSPHRSLLDWPLEILQEWRSL